MYAWNNSFEHWIENPWDVFDIELPPTRGTKQIAHVQIELANVAMHHKAAVCYVIKVDY